ncbi:MAG: helix-hairpin-helix domain-containing protein [Candidatus Bathyarchaeota archaeon]|nr:helix-hairpin-helix domain-containing protein [Candidatus Bathyarchaeota archaeon]
MEKIRVEKAEPEGEAPSTVDEAEEAEVTTAGASSVSDIKGVGSATEEKLKKAGFMTVESVAAAETAELSEKTGISEKTVARLIDSAKELLNN